MSSDVNLDQVVKNTLLVAWIQLNRTEEKTFWWRNLERYDLLVL